MSGVRPPALSAAATRLKRRAISRDHEWRLGPWPRENLPGVPAMQPYALRMHSLRRHARRGRLAYARRVNLDALVAELDDYFRVADVAEDDWGPVFEQVYDEPYWREYVEPGWPGWWKGLMVRGGADVERIVTTVFPRDGIFARFDPRTLVFTEHPLDFADEPGFVPWSRDSFERLRANGISVYAVHWPLDVHEKIAPSLLCARGAGLEAIETFFEGAAAVGESRLTLDGLADALRLYLGDDVKVHVLTRPRPEAGRVAVVAGGGALREVLEEAVARGCRTYVTGNAATNCVLDFVQAEVRAFRELADEHGIALLDAMHYGTEKPPQLAMVDWFRRRGLDAEFVTTGPK
jgi:putative NIF3 family GTP cyclohydrolase 1 type 2